jgi:hypothetical protein
MAYKMINVTVISGTISNFPDNKQNREIRIAVQKSITSIIFRLFMRSAIIPPIGKSIIIGIKEDAIIVPNKADEPV